MNLDGTYRFSGGSDKNPPDMKKLGRIVLIAAAVILVLITVFTSFYTVDD